MAISPHDRLHAGEHATGQPDALTPANIGAEAAGAVDAHKILITGVHGLQVTAPADDEVLQYDNTGGVGEGWANKTLAAAGIEAAGVCLPLAGGTMTGRQVLCGLAVTGLSGTYNNYNPAGFSNCQVLKVSQDALSGGVVFTGFAAAGEYTVLRIYNADPTLTITLNHNDAGSDVANRIFDPLGANTIVIAYACVDYIYIASRWRPVS